MPVGQDPHVVMVGLMGAGKTTIGRLVAGELGVPFADNDEALTRTTGSSADEIDRQHGLEHLHRLEAEVLLELLAAPAPTVVSAAASVVEDARCLRALSGTPVVVWLHAPIEELAERADQGRHRPLSGRNATTVLAGLSERRDPLYRRVADVDIDVGSLDPDEAAAEVVAWISWRRCRR